jgi:arabinoxylan arabinofuranohydrolase
LDYGVQERPRLLQNSQSSGQWYFFYHNAVLTLPNGETGALGRRSVCIEYLYYNPDGTIKPIKQTKQGVGVPP